MILDANSRTVIFLCAVGGKLFKLRKGGCKVTCVERLILIDPVRDSVRQKIETIAWMQLERHLLKKSLLVNAQITARQSDPAVMLSRRSKETIDSASNAG